MSKLSRDRGAAFEREVCADIKRVLGVDVKRKLGQARDSGNDIDFPPYRIECKRRRTLAVDKWLAQCERGAMEGEIPLVIARSDRGYSVAVLSLDWLLLLIGGQV
jgi:hypothetical protein